MNNEIKVFSSGIHNTLIDTIIPQDASSNSYNWITQDGRIKLAGGRIRTGGTGTVGKINGLWTGYKTNGDKVLYRKTTDKLQYYNGTNWIDILTGLTDTEFSFANYSSLAGAFTLINGEDGFYLINNANPDSAIDLYDSTKNFKGFIIVDRGRCLLWNRDNDKTGLYGSWIDAQNSTVYTSVSGESLGSSGSTHYTGILAFKGSTKRNCFNVSISASISGGTETFTDDYNGNLTSDKGGTGTINYATGAYDITFNNTTTSGPTADYQWQDFTNKGLADFSKSATRLAGEGFQFPQDEGGDPILNVLIGQDGAYYSIKEKSVYKLTLSDDDTNAENIVYRKNIGIENWKGAISTSLGIVFINSANPERPELTILKKNQFDNIEPYVITPQFKFADYKYDQAAMGTYERYVLLACRTSDSAYNNRILMINVEGNTVDVIRYQANWLTTKDDELYIGSPIVQEVYQILTGYDDLDLSIPNEWISKGEDYGTQTLKKFRRLRFKGMIDPEQTVEIYGNFDDAGYSLLATISGKAGYVSVDNPQVIGSNFIGTSLIGSDNTTSTYPFFCELRVKVPKFQKRNIKIKATGIGYVEIQQMTDWNILTFENRISKQYRIKRT